MNFLERLSQYVLKGKDTSILPEIALQGLEEGYETPSLILLAGLGDTESPFLVDEYFKKMLQELNLDLSDKKQAALLLVNSISDKILNGQIDVYEGCDFIFKQALDLTDLRGEDKKFVYDSVGLAEVYSLYVTVWELMHASVKWDKVKTNEQLIEDTKQSIKDKLAVWRNGSLTVT